MMKKTKDQLTRGLGLPLLTLALLLPFAPMRGVAQSYDLAFGLRLGTDWGLTAQARMPIIHKNFAAEGIVQSSFQREEAMLTLLGKQHYPLLTRRINVFAGAGLHKGWNTDEEIQPYADPFGITGIAGAEVTLGRLNLSYDFKPAINIAGGEKTFYTQSGISLRYVVSKRNDIYDKGAERDRNKKRRQRDRDKRRRQREKDGKSEWWKVWERDGE